MPIKLTDQDIQEMVRLYQEGQNTYQLAVLYRIDSSTVASYLKKRGIQLRGNAEYKRKYTIRQDAFSIVSDEHTAYWLGFLYADGCICVRRGGAEKGVHLFLQKQDEPHVQAFASFLGSTSPIKQDSRYQTCGIRIYSTPLVDDLIRLGCTQNKSQAFSLKPPALPKELAPHFIRGYFDGDGSAFITDGTPTLSLCGNENFLTSLQGIIFTYTKIEGGIYPHSVSKQVRYLIYRGIGKCSMLTQWLYQDATIFLERKLETIKAFPISKRPPVTSYRPRT